MTIKQFNGTYLAHDDRLLFRFNTIEDKEFKFWLTRRVTLFILSATQHLLIKGLAQNHGVEVAKAILEFGNEAIHVEKEGKSSAPDIYQAASDYPLGADPVLVLDVKCTLEKQGEEDILLLDLILPGGANVNLRMPGPTFQSMCALLNQLREHAAWGGVPKVQEQISEKKVGVSPSNKSFLH